MESELSADSKHVVHNAFVVLVLIPTCGLLNCTINEIEQTDIEMRKVLCILENFHRNFDIDRRCVQRKNGGRVLKCIEKFIKQELQLLNTIYCNRKIRIDI